VNAVRRKVREKRKAKRVAQREGEEEAGVAPKSPEKGKRHRRIESVGQDKY
jgi:hypothetical protein